MRSIVLAGAVLAGSASARAQIATLDKGHRIFLQNGLQVWGAATDTRYSLDYSTVTGANLTGVVWGFPPFPDGGPLSNASALAPGQKWGRWTDWHYGQEFRGQTVSPQTALTPDEVPHQADLVALQVGDESNQSDMESGSLTKNWFLAAGNGTATTADDVFPNTLLYVNSFFIGSHAGYANFLATANPDAISWDSYPFSNPAGAIITPTNWLALGQQFRRHGLGSYIGATNASPRPYGMFVQTFHDSTNIDPGEAQIRWQQFAAWTMGYSWVDAFIFLGGNNHFADQTTPLYAQFAETARQGRNLGPALTRLISTGYGTSIVPGQNADGSGRGVPGDWLLFNQANGPAAQQYLTSLSAQNLGTKNGGRPGDVYVGFFNPLLGALANPTGEAYFMVTNGLGGDLTLPNGSADNTATAAETQQAVTMNFDFVGTRVTSLQRLRRGDGQLEVVPLTANGGAFSNLYKTTITLDGGTGDLFKFNDGTPFVGVETVWHWDPDGSAAGNDALSGAGTGGAGSWDGAGTKWSDGMTNAAASAGKHVVFWGPGGGAVTLGGAGQSAYSLAFKTNGYTLGGAPLTMTGPAVTVDAGVNATIASAIAGSAGLNKLGAGTLVLTGANTYSGGTYVGGGVLRVSSDAAFGAGVSILPTTPFPTPPDNIWINNGTLQFDATFTLNANRGIQIGASGGTIDVAAGAEVTYAANRGFRGFDLVKTGPGTFFAAGTGGGTNNIWAGNLIIREGTWKVQASDGLPLNPTGGGLRPGQVTLDGGTWQWAASKSVTNANRGITVAAGGGTIDTQGFDVTWAGPISGSVATAVLNKAGSGTLALQSAAYASNYQGIVNVNGGTLMLNNGAAMGDTASVVLANAPGVRLWITSNETIGSLAGGGAAGGNTTVDAGLTFTVGGNGKTTTYGGVISGTPAKVMKTGTGTMVLTGVNTYSGVTAVAQGTLEVSGSGTVGTGGVSVDGGVFRLAAGGATAVLRSLAVSAGQADLTDRNVVIDYAAGNDPVTSVVAALLSGRHGGLWDGPGIVSSTAAGDGRTAIGWAEQSDLGVGTWGGVGVDATSLLLRYTYYGDANLDGKVNADDFARADRGLAKGLSGWVNGDFNYDGTVNAGDYLLMDSAYASQGGALSPEFLAAREAQFGPAYVGELMASVPEPVGLGALALAIGAGLRRRRQRSR